MQGYSIPFGRYKTNEGPKPNWTQLYQNHDVLFKSSNPRGFIVISAESQWHHYLPVAGSWADCYLKVTFIEDYREAL